MRQRDLNGREIILRYEIEQREDLGGRTKYVPPTQAASQAGTIELGASGARQMYPSEIIVDTQLGGDGKETPYHFKIGLQRKDHEVEMNKLEAAARHLISVVDDNDRLTIEKTPEGEQFNYFTDLRRTQETSTTTKISE